LRRKSNETQYCTCAREEKQEEMVKKKGKSKRLTLKQKNRNRTRAIARDRKARKLQKRAGVKPGTGKKLKRDPGIPNLAPFKEKLLRRMEYQRKKMEKHNDHVKAARKALREKKREESRKSMEQLAAEALSRGITFEEEQKQRDAMERELRAGITNGPAAKATRRAFASQLKRVVASADVIIEVLDARDPDGCRARHLENLILPKGKKLVMVLNKVDLVPRSVTEKWLAHLRRHFPCIAFKASTQSKGKRLGRTSGISAESASAEALQSSKCVGADTLLQLLKNYCRSADVKTSITVGVVGFPNVGKSSLINSLKREKAVGVSPVPGFTRSMQEVVIDRNIKLLDCPGVIFDGDKNEGSGLVLRNCISVDQLEDPVGALESLHEKCKAEFLMEFYEIRRFASADEFVCLVAHKFGRLKKGGVPDREAAARSVLRDLYTGKLPFYTLPPKMERPETDHVDASIESSFAKELDLDALYNMSDRRVVNSVAGAAIDEDDCMAVGE